MLHQRPQRGTRNERSQTVADREHRWQARARAQRRGRLAAPDIEEEDTCGA